MPIEKGKPWGRALPRPADLLELDGDAAIASYAIAEPARGPATVVAGDVHRSLGGPVTATSRSSMQLVKLDLLRVRADDRAQVAVAHVIARPRGPFGWWRGPIVAICNVDHVGAWNVAPRAHPNDGRLDVVDVDASMSIRTRIQARRRLGQGTHVPHPAISVKQTTTFGRHFERPLNVYVDGRSIGLVARLEVSVEADAFELYV